GSSTREVLRCLLEGLRWLWGAEVVRVAGRSGISQARSRLGEAPLQRLYEVSSDIRNWTVPTRRTGHRITRSRPLDLHQ
ncbi:MAG TPA: transposase domain-containing protein, partial [Armatimonadota bacterium]|nr:transposase domain-containing protein [Armatimonadota bacterium]